MLALVLSILAITAPAEPGRAVSLRWMEDYEPIQHVIGGYRGGYAWGELCDAEHGGGAIYDREAIWWDLTGECLYVHDTLGTRFYYDDDGQWRLCRSLWIDPSSGDVWCEAAYMPWVEWVWNDGPEEDWAGPRTKRVRVQLWTPRTDYDRDGDVDTQDVIDFLSDWVWQRG
jgi:hypothetical protein